MKIWPFLFMMLLYNHATGQKSFTCTCKGFIDTSFKGNIAVFENPAGKPTSVIKYQHKKSNYLIFDIDKVADSFFYIRMKYVLTGESYRGWIKKSGFLVTTLIKSANDILLFAEPGAASRIRYSIPGPASGNYQIFNCSKSWIYVKGIRQKPFVEGWLQTKDQCAQPVSACD